VYMRLANWPFSHIDYSKNNGKPTSEDYPMLCLKWFVTSCIISFFVCPSYPALLILSIDIRSDLQSQPCRDCRSEWRQL
jgi:hypothetical protein